MTATAMSRLPSVDALLRAPALQAYLADNGRVAVTRAVRAELDDCRARLREGGGDNPPVEALVTAIIARLETLGTPKLKAMFNLTGTVLHTNLGRALLPEAAVEHAAMAMRNPCNLEFEVDGGGRGDRDSIVDELLCELTGAEAATVVNNNAAAVLLVLAALAGGREVVVSRGELVEIGGAFRIPDVMRSAQAHLVEIGTTNRTHPRDYEDAIGPQTAALMKVHTSNYRVTGFTSSVSETDVARIAHAASIPLVVDLGAGSLIDMTRYDLPAEPVAADIVAAGADIVTFSADKLLGGPQAGLIVGRKDLIATIKRHPLKRAVRLSKVVIAALEATLSLYRKPDLLARDLPTLRLLTRSLADLRELAARLSGPVAGVLGDGWTVTTVDTGNQVGSGSVPEALLPGVALSLAPADGSGRALDTMAERLRALPIPVVGRIADGALLLELRCLEDEAGFVGQLGELRRQDA